MMYCISCGRHLEFDPMLSTYMSPNMVRLAVQRMEKQDAMKFDVVYCPYCGTKYYVEAVSRSPSWDDTFHSMAFMKDKDGELHLTATSLIFVEAYTLKQTVFELRQIFHPSAEEQHLSFLYRGYEKPVHILVYEEYGRTWAAKIAEACQRIRENLFTGPETKADEYVPG